jgi:hypothetical protein
LSLYIAQQVNGSLSFSLHIAQQVNGSFAFLYCAIGKWVFHLFLSILHKR